MIRSVEEWIAVAPMLGVPVSQVEIPKIEDTVLLKLVYKFCDKNGSVVGEGEISEIKPGRNIVVFDRIFGIKLST